MWRSQVVVPDVAIRIVGIQPQVTAAVGVVTGEAITIPRCRRIHPMRNPATLPLHNPDAKVLLLVSGESELRRFIDCTENSLVARCFIPGEQCLEHATLGP